MMQATVQTTKREVTRTTPVTRTQLAAKTVEVRADDELRKPLRVLAQHFSSSTEHKKVTSVQEIAKVLEKASLPVQKFGVAGGGRGGRSPGVFITTAANAHRKRNPKVPTIIVDKPSGLKKAIASALQIAKSGGLKPVLITAKPIQLSKPLRALFSDVVPVPQLQERLLQEPGGLQLSQWSLPARESGPSVKGSGRRPEQPLNEAGVSPDKEGRKPSARGKKAQAPTSDRQKQGQISGIETEPKEGSSFSVVVKERARVATERTRLSALEKAWSYIEKLKAHGITPVLAETSADAQSHIEQLKETSTQTGPLSFIRKDKSDKVPQRIVVVPVEAFQGVAIEGASVEAVRESTRTETTKDFRDVSAEELERFEAQVAASSQRRREQELSSQGRAPEATRDTNNPVAIDLSQESLRPASAGVALAQDVVNFSAMSSLAEFSFTASQAQQEQQPVHASQEQELQEAKAREERNFEQESRREVRRTVRRRRSRASLKAVPQQRAA